MPARTLILILTALWAAAYAASLWGLLMTEPTGDGRTAERQAEGDFRCPGPTRTGCYDNELPPLVLSRAGPRLGDLHSSSGAFDRTERRYRPDELLSGGMRGKNAVNPQTLEERLSGRVCGFIENAYNTSPLRLHLLDQPATKE